MQYRESAAQLGELRRQIADIRAKMQEVQAATEPEPVADYIFQTADGSRSLSSLFGGQRKLIVIHNMVVACDYCTLWADGFNGVYRHIAQRAALVVSSPDAPGAQRRFAAGRGWTFPMVSHQGCEFATDMGYRSAKGGWLPGVSVFRREDDRIVRVADTGFQPGDDFCTLWHLVDLLPGGRAGWSPEV
jgi:predicted dithiol-disulfide oxidoreductase (DUF899 family)